MAGLETRRMGRTEMRPASLGLGAAWLANGSERETIDAVHRAIDLGINYIDTYPRRQEDRWGKALEGGLRQKVYLQAKVSPPTEAGQERLLRLGDALQRGEQPRGPQDGLSGFRPNPRSD